MFDSMTTTANESDQTNNCPLLHNLPPELRLIIYEQVLLAASPIISCVPDPQSWRKYSLKTQNLLQANRQIAAEALPIYERLLRDEHAIYEREAAEKAAKYRSYHSWHAPGFCPSVRGRCIWLDVQAQRARDGADEVGRLVEREMRYWEGRLGR